MQNIIKKLFLIVVMMGAGFTALAQNIVVTGRVVDAKTNEAIIGATILVRNSTIGVITDINGNYSINVPGKNATLVFSFLGYTSQSVVVGEKTIINVSLSEDVKAIEEVVVIGYGTQKKESVVGAISSVGTKELLRSPTSNITQAIAGRLAGVSTTQNQGQPGYDEAKIFIRGRASFASDNQPLVLVDGVERSFSQIAPDDIDQVSILKDASATAVYGVRGANGVILVTTKRGFIGKPEVSITANYSLQTPTRGNTILDSYNSVKLLEEALANDGLPSQYTETDIENFRLATLGQLSGDMKYLYPNVNWYNQVLNKYAPTQQYSVNISGGTKRLRYFTSLTYFDQRGLYKENNNYDYGQSSNARYQRYSFRANLDFLLTKQFTMSVNLGTRFEDRKGPNVREEDRFNTVFYEINRTPGWRFPVQWEDGRYGGNAFAQNNIVGRLANGGFYSKTNNINETSMILKHDLYFITRGLSIKAMGSFDYYNDYDRRFLAEFATYELLDRNGSLANLNNYIKYNDDSPLTNSGNTQITSLKTYLEAGLNYAHNFSDKHDITGLLLYNQSNFRYQANISERYQGFVGRMTYNYSRRYFLEMNFGFNGSENFVKGNRFGFFPSVSAGWAISNESFMKSLGWLQNLKLRASYGEVGNDVYKINGQKVRFLYVSSWIQGGGYTFGETGTQAGIFEGNAPNLSVTWERAKKYNVGLDAAILNKLVDLQFDIFYEKRDDILTPYLTKPSWLAVSLAPGNLGRTKNKGFDLELKHRKKIGDITYFLNTSFARAKNTIEYKDEPAAEPSYLKMEGRPINQYFGLVAEGFYTSADIANPDLPVQTFGAVKVGDLKYRDMNSDGYIDLRDQTAIGYSDVPENTYSISFGGDYKGFSLSIMFQGVSNVSRFYDAEAMFAFYNGGKVREHHMNRWNPNTSEAENLANAKYPLLHYGSGGNNNHQLNSFFLQNGSFMRLKNIEVSYTLPTALAKKMHTSEVRVYVNGNNLITWDHLDGIADPESNGSNTYPIMTVYNAGINVKF